MPRGGNPVPPSPGSHQLVVQNFVFPSSVDLDEHRARFRVVACNTDVSVVPRAATILRELSKHTVALAAIRDYLMKLPLDM